MQSSEVRAGFYSYQQPPSKIRRMSGIIFPTQGEIPPHILDGVQIAYESTDEGFAVEGTNTLVAAVQLVALRRDLSA